MAEDERIKYNDIYRIHLKLWKNTMVYRDGLTKSEELLVNDFANFIDITVLDNYNNYRGLLKELNEEEHNDNPPERCGNDSI